MSRRAVDEREQRRGLVLGLTLAEVLLLILFLLMLALGSRIEYWRTEAETSQQSYNELLSSQESLKEIQTALFKNGAVDIVSVQALIARLKRVEELEHSVSALKQENSDLSAQTALLRSLGSDTEKVLLSIAPTLEKARQIDPKDPPALLKRALDIIERLGASTQPEQVKPLSQMTADLQIKQQLASVEADRDKLKQQLDGLRGNGLTYPPCWPATRGKTEYMFDVIAKDNGIIVRDAFLESKRNDPAWKNVDSFPRNALINDKQFNEATGKLLLHTAIKIIVGSTFGCTMAQRHKVRFDTSTSEPQSLPIFTCIQ